MKKSEMARKTQRMLREEEGEEEAEGDADFLAQEVRSCRRRQGNQSP
jgi:hypothetical protein